MLHGGKTAVSASLVGLNEIGLERRGMKDETIKALRSAVPDDLPHREKSRGVAGEDWRPTSAPSQRCAAS